MGRTTRRWVALAAAGAMSLAGCGAGGGQDATTVSPEAGAAQDEQGEGSRTDGTEAAAGQEVEDVEEAGTHLARTAALTVTVEDIARASARARSIAAASGGYVSREETHTSPDDGGAPDASWAEIVVTVPVDELDATVDDLARIGEVVTRSGDVQDLTQQYTDTSSRVRTLEKSVARLQELIDSAADLKEVVSLESELTRREADLESMTSRLKALEKRTSTAPITVSLQTSHDEPEDSPGFLAGLASGWNAFTTALGVGMTALGAVTPFAVTGLLLLAPVLWWLRRRLRAPGQGA